MPEEYNEKGEGNWKAELYYSLGFRVKGSIRQKILMLLQKLSTLSTVMKDPDQF